MKNNSDPIDQILKGQFREFLVDAGYKEKTPSGRPSTVDDYVNRISFVCEQEQLNWSALAERIGQVIVKYDTGGEKEELGQKSHHSVINALRQFQIFLRDL